MKSSEQQLWDWFRIFVGDVPSLFMVEVIIRVIVIYILLILSMRIMGKRMSSMISRNEMIAMVSLAAAIGVPMQDPERGLLPAIIISIVVIGVQRIITVKTFNKPKLENLLLGNTDILINEGRIELKNMENARITQERLFSELRSHSIINLGKIQRMYMETNGEFTIYKYDGIEKEGMCLLPEWDKEFLHELTWIKNKHCCCSCGFMVEGDQVPNYNCTYCNQKKWTPAIKTV